MPGFLCNYVLSLIFVNVYSHHTVQYTPCIFVSNVSCKFIRSNTSIAGTKTTFLHTPSSHYIIQLMQKSIHKENKILTIITSLVGVTYYVSHSPIPPLFSCPSLLLFF